MSDPKRLLDEGGDDLGVSLLKAARTLDAERARERREVILGAAAGLTAAAAATQATKGFLAGLLTKWTALGLLTAAVAIGAGILVRATTPPPDLPPPAPHVRAAPTVLAAPPTASAGAPGASGEAANGAPPRLVIAVESLPDVPYRSSAAGRAPPPATTSLADAEDAPLAEEVAALRDAKGALSEGAFGRALAALDAYAERFPGGHLALEAEVLRIEALSGSGARAAASARARRFLLAHPESPYAHRLRALAGDALSNP